MEQFASFSCKTIGFSVHEAVGLAQTRLGVARQVHGGVKPEGAIGLAAWGLETKHVMPWLERQRA